MNALPDTVIELRQYTLVPGARDRFIDRFEAHFLASQAAAGAHVLGHFRDLDRPDHFVWLRGFADLEARTAALTEFYQSSAWLAHRQAANAELIDNDDVLLLKPVDPAGLTSGSGPSLIVLVIADLDPGEDPAPLQARLSAALNEAGGQPLAALVTEPGPNGFPRLPVREGETVLVLIARFPPGADPKGLAGPPGRRIERLRLQPAARSALR